MNFNVQQTTQDIDNDMAFMSFDFFTTIDTTFLAVILGLYAWGIDNSIGGQNGVTRFWAAEFSQLI